MSSWRSSAYSVFPLALCLSSVRDQCGFSLFLHYPALPWSKSFLVWDDAGRLTPWPLLAIICDLFSIQSRKLRSNNIWFEFKQVRARSEGLSVSGTLCRFGPYQHQNHLPYLQNGANLLAGRNVMSISTCIIQGPLLGFRPNVCPANTVIYVTFFYLSQFTFSLT